MLVTILAGGMGKRMQSSLPKVLHLVDGIPMIIRILNQVVRLSPIKIYLVVGQHYDQIKNMIEMQLDRGKHLIEYVIQDEPLGTGNAVLKTLPYIQKYSSYHNLILNGDTPMLTYKTLKEITNNNDDLLITAINLEKPYGNGRIITNNNKFVGIIEEKDCNDKQQKITLVNVGIYYVKVSILLDIIPQITNNNNANEYYLTDIVKLFKNPSLHILNTSKLHEITNVNTKEDLVKLQI